MEQYIGLDISQNETAISIQQGGSPDLARQVRIRSHRPGSDYSQTSTICEARGFRDGSALDVVLPCAIG